MIRRDYIIRIIEEFAQKIARIQAALRARHLSAAQDEIETACADLVAEGPDALATMDLTTLKSRLASGPFGPMARERCLYLTALLRESAEIHARNDRPQESLRARLKALELLLDALLSTDTHALPNFVPRLETMLDGLDPVDLPPHLLGALMLHYERLGALGRAEDMLWHLRDQAPSNPNVLRHGQAFYERLLAQPDVVLHSGGLPREEVLKGWQDWRADPPK